MHALMCFHEFCSKTMQNFEYPSPSIEKLIELIMIWNVIYYNYGHFVAWKVKVDPSLFKCEICTLQLMQPNLEGILKSNS